MRAPLSWLRDYAPFPDDVDLLARTLSELGLVVDGVERVGEGLDGVVVARVAAIRPHPQADRIRLVDVDRGDGGGETLQVACGAWNFAEGDLVPFATVGAVLPGGMEIGRRKMRGEWSNGMLCSPSEVGLPPVPGVDGLLILEPGLAAPGTPFADALGIEPDVVFDLDVTANRPDALCVAGVARDLAAALQLPFTWPDVGAVAVDPALPAAAVRVDPAASSLCPRFTGTVLEGVRVGPSPAWIARRLTLAGMRPINNVVDVSNYVMLDVGQPNHAYDLATLGGGGIEVRRARADEQVVTLDGATRTLQPDDCVICDATSVPVGIAGVMGGADSEISDATTSVLLEAAWFAPMAVARTGTRLRLTSEARHRFERGVDPLVADRAVARFADLLAAAGNPGLRRGPTTDVRDEGELPAPPTVVLRTARVAALLGAPLTDDEVAGLLTRLGFGCRPHGDGVFAVEIPSWRPDSDREIDVVEEVARLHGYGRIPRTLPTAPRTAAGLTPHQQGRRRVRAALVGAGLSEAWTTTFLAPGDLERAGLPGGAVRVANPLDAAESLLRTSLLPGLLKAVRHNVDRQQPDVRLFEVGRVFDLPIGDATLPAETELLGVVCAGAGVDGRLAARLWGRLAAGLRLAAPPGEALVAAAAPGLHPGRSAHVVDPNGQPLGVLGEVDDEVARAYGVPGRLAWLQVDLARLLALPTAPWAAPAISRFPASDIDLAFLVPASVPAAAVAATIRSAAAGGPAPLESVRLFDAYRDPSLGEGRRSLAYRLRFRSDERTLTDAEIGAARTAVIAAVESACDAALRA
ncbi:MAG TPA: phenylalanine--tRNA ligase subunit beta [Acidimicrobiales bacterium]|nr:phenylalanine--tRNA ligase subunit beta [Acidimicrobiales bacterium]